MTDDAEASDTPSGGRSRPRRWKTYFWAEAAILLGITGLLAALILPPVRGPREAARRTQCISNLHSVSLALLHYSEQYGALPPAHTVDSAGNSLHSWRTLILPYLGQPALYQTIDLSKPWNDPVNAEAYRSIPAVYRCPNLVDVKDCTTYLAIVAPGGCFRQNEPRKFDEITDDHGQTLMIIEAPRDQAVHWMAPLDASEEMVLKIGPESKLDHVALTIAVFVDGHVQSLNRDVPIAKWRAMISIAGNDSPGEF